MKTALRRTGIVVGVGALAGLGYVGSIWARYGKVSRKEPTDPLLDRYIPSYEVREVHHTRIAAPAEVTYAVARELDMQASPLVKAIFSSRQIFMGARATARKPQSLISEVLSLGWRVLAEEPSHLVMGAVTQPWKANVEFHGLAPEEFAAFDRPEFVKIAWTISVRPMGAEASEFRTETRVQSTDPEARRRFRRYWTLVNPGVRLIRREMLRLVRKEAERRSGAHDCS